MATPSVRIAALARLALPARGVADVGCDHGLVLAEIRKQVPCFVQAIDEKAAPLAAARNNLAGLADCEFTESFGLSKLSERCDVAIIAGLGGEEIVKILTAADFKNLEKLVLAPHRQVPKVRAVLAQCGFKITAEEVVAERGKFYELIVATRGVRPLSPREVQFGPENLAKKSPAFVAMWRKRAAELAKHPAQAAAVAEIMEVLNAV